MGCREDALELADQRKEWLELQNVVHASNAADEVARELHGDARFNGDYIEVHVDAKDDHTAQRALAILARWGFHQAEGRTRGYETIGKWCLSTYRPNGTDKEYRGQMQVNVYLALKGTKCRLVQVGEKTEPIYDLQCDGE